MVTGEKMSWYLREVFVDWSRAAEIGIMVSTAGGLGKAERMRDIACQFVGVAAPRYLMRC